MGYLFPVVSLCIANILFWFKGNSKELFDLQWTPFQWWLYTSLVTNYLTLYAWWKLIEISDVWRAGVTWGLISLVVDLSLNTYFYGFNWRGISALVLCGLAAFIAHH